jgi:transposase-like protein
MLHDHRCEYPSTWAAIESIARKIGCAPQTLHEWVREHEVENGVPGSITSSVVQVQAR